MFKVFITLQIKISNDKTSVTHPFQLSTAQTIKSTQHGQKMRDPTAIYICVTIFIFMIVAMVIAGTQYSWDYWYVYSPLMFGGVFFVFCILYSIMLASEPPRQRVRVPPPNRQIRTIEVVTTETINPAFQMEPVQSVNLPGYSTVDAPPKYTDVVKEPENITNNTENNNSENNNGSSPS